MCDPPRIYPLLEYIQFETSICDTPGIDIDAENKVYSGGGG